MRDFDVAVLGAGVAGTMAATIAARHGLSVCVIERLGAGGQVMNVDNVHNFPGFPEGIAGYELGPLLQQQAEDAGAEFLLDTLQTLEVDGHYRLLKAADETIRARAVIVATGSEKKTLGVPGESALQGRGVSHCASCDGPLFRGRQVCVVGGGDSALEEALSLAAHAGKVTIIHRGAEFTAQKYLADRIAATANVDVLFNHEVVEIFGDSIVEAVSVHNLATGSIERRPTEGVFIYIGLAPQTGFLPDTVHLDAAGRIQTDSMMQTSLAGVFAAGDVRSDSVALLACSAGDGATAAVMAHRYVRS